MGRYVPPEHEGTTSANKLAGKHALGSRARKSGQGILTVRFEMPFPIWCTTCPKPSIIGQGVRFNAEKKKVGNYHTTPIFSFRMKHVACGGWIEIRTDPKNTAYVVMEGAKKRDTGEDKVHEGEIRIRTEEERERLANDAFAALEGKVEDKRQASSDKSRIEELQSMKEKQWEDPGEANRKLRNHFRVGRKLRRKNEEITENLKDRMSLGMDLLEETEEDRRRVRYVDFGATNDEVAIVKAQSRPLFQDTVAKIPLAKRIKASKAASGAGTSKEALRKELSNNTRVVTDPFLQVKNSRASSTSSVSLVKKRTRSAQDHDTTTKSGDDYNQNKTSVLVNYDSD